MFEILVALRRQQLQVDALDEAAPVDADLLRRHADPGVTRRGQGAMEEPPVGRGVDAGRHVVPLDHDRPTEPQRILGPARHEPGPEGSLGTGGHVPVAVGTALALQFVEIRRALEAVLDLLVAERGQVVVPHDVRRRARHFLEHSLSCAGHNDPPGLEARGSTRSTRVVDIFFLLQELEARGPLEPVGRVQPLGRPIRPGVEDAAPCSQSRSRVSGHKTPASRRHRRARRRGRNRTANGENTGLGT